MKDNLPPRGIRRLLLVLLVSGVALLTGCGADSDADVDAPSLTMNATSVQTTSGNRTLSGTVEAGASVLVTVGTVETTAVVAGTAWSAAIDLAPGTNSVVIRASDAAGNSRSLSFFLTYDAVTFEVYTTPTAVDSQTIYGLLDPTLQGGLSVSLNGSEVTVVVNGDVWSADLTGLMVGDNAVTVTLTDASLPDGTLEGTLTLNVNPDAPAIAFADAGIVRTALPSRVVGGSFDPGTSGVFLSPLPSETLPVGSTGTGLWSATYSQLSIGKNPIVASVTGNNVTAAARSLIIVEQSPPLVRQVSPADGAAGVAVDAVVTARFDVEMAAATLAAGFTLADNLGAAVPAGVAYDAATKTATLTPAAALAPGASYTASLETTVTDAAGTPLAQTLSWSFTTAP